LLCSQKGVNINAQVPQFAAAAAAVFVLLVDIAQDRWHQTALKEAGSAGAQWWQSLCDAGAAPLSPLMQL